MKREIIKIQSGNETNLSIRALLPDGITTVPIDQYEGFQVEHVYFTINGHEIEIPDSEWIEKDGLLVVPIHSDLVVGKYGIHVTGLMVSPSEEGTPAVDCNFIEAFEIVPYSDNVRYDMYHTDIFIVGLPDAELERLKAEYAAKVSEYQGLVDELKRGEVATKSDLGLEPGETVAGLIKAGGGGGGGGLTPEQWAKIAKDETVAKAATMAGYQSSNTAKLNQIIANTSLTAAQADEDWKNVTPA